MSLTEIPKDWTIVKPKEVYVDIKNNQYVSIFLADQEVIPEKLKRETFSNFYEEFLNIVAAALGKSPSREEIDKNILNVKILEDFISPFPNTKQKALFGIKKSYIEEMTSSEPVNLDQTSKTIFVIKDFNNKITTVAEKFRIFQSEYIKDIFKRNNVGYKSLDFILEANNLESFSSNLSNLFLVNSLSPSEKDMVEFYFTDKMEIKAIFSIIGTKRQELKISFSDFVKNNPQKRPTTSNFISNLSQLHDVCKKNNVTYTEIVENYFFYQPTKNNKSNFDVIERTNKESSSYGISNDQVLNQQASFSEVSQRSKKLFQEIALNSVYDKPCLTAEEKNRKDLELEEDQEKKIKFGEQVENAIGDAFLDGLPEILQKVAKKQGSAALRALGSDVLNRLGACGLGDLVSLVANTAMSYLNPDEYSQEISKCALENLKNDQIYTFAKEISKFGKNTEILDKYRQIVGDQLPPWSTNGYRPPVSSNLQSNNPLIEEYTLKTDKIGDNQLEIDFRFTAYKDSIRATIKPKDLLETLMNLFPDEMGWINFFTELVETTIKNCTGAEPASLNVDANLNICKRIAAPKFPEISISSSSISPSFLTDLLIENIKNIIIGVMVKVITSTMSQLFQIISAGVSGDTDYFKRGDYIPDLFQNENYMNNALYNQDTNNKKNQDSVNESVKKMIYESSVPRNSSNTLSNIEVSDFLKKISVSIGEYDKIKLLKGESSQTTYIKVSELIENTAIQAFLNNYSNIEAFFLEMGKYINVTKLENNYFNNIYNSPPPSEYCIIDGEMLDRAYYNNKPSITEEQVKRMKDRLADIQKDKLCYSAKVLGNPISPIFGQELEDIMAKDGPVYGAVSDMQSGYLLEALESQFKILLSSYHTNLYSDDGFFNTILNEGSGSTPSTLITFEDYSTIEDPLGTPMGASTYKANTSKISSLLNESLSPIPLLKSNIIHSFTSKTFDIHIEEYSNLIINKTKDNPPDAFDIKYWKNKYDLFTSNKNIKLLLGISTPLSSDPIYKTSQEIYKKIDIKNKNSSYVIFNPLTSKEDIVSNYFFFSILINLILSETFIQSASTFATFNENTFVNKKTLSEYVKKKLDDLFSSEKLYSYEKISQIFFKMIDVGIINETDDTLKSVALSFNSEIKDWLSGKNNKRGEILTNNEFYLDFVVNKFINNAVSSYFKSTTYGYLTKLFNDDELINKKVLSLGGKDKKIDVFDVFSNVDNVKITRDTPYLRVEKYIDVGESINNSTPSGIQNMESLSTYIEGLTLNKISDTWPQGWKYGIRISSVYKFSNSGINASEMNEVNEEREKNKAFLLKGSALSEEMFLLPIIKFEESIPDQEAKKEIINNYNDRKMIEELTSSSKFNEFYYKGMNIENLLSSLTIYNNNFDGFGNFFNDSKKLLVAFLRTN